MKNLFNILMVDDDQDDHDIFRTSLRNVSVNGHKMSDMISMVSTYNGNEGMDYLMKTGEFRSSRHPLPDFIVLDLNMPILDGYTMLKQISLNPEMKQIPVYVFTTSKDEVDKKKCLQFSNCAGFFSKPGSRKDIIPIIEQMLNVYTD